MIRQFRAIVQTSKEPQDHEVLWYWKGKVLFWNNGEWQPFHLIDAIEVAYTSEEAEEVKTVHEALDKLLYVTPKINTFTLKQAGTYEKGVTISNLDFSWTYNKKLIREQRLDGIDLTPNIRQATIEKDITSNTSFTLWASDGTNEVTASTSIRFVDYIYYGVMGDEVSDNNRLKINPASAGINITANVNEYIWIFIPRSAGYTKLWHNNVDSTDDFIYTPTDFVTDTNLSVAGTLYVSKNHSLNNVILKFT